MNAPALNLSEDGRRIYRPGGPVLSAFMMDRSEIAIIRGPWGSGKSIGCGQRIFQHSVEQNVDAFGGRRSRWFAIRDTYPRLETTTMETWLQWFPESRYGKMYTGSRPYLQEIRLGNIKLDVFFMAVDDLAGEGVFASLEPTGIWWNELEYATMKQFFDAHGRLGRYPPKEEGGSKWVGTLADCNAPPAHHWLPMITGEVELPEDIPEDERIAYVRPPEMAYFVQPPAVFAKRDADGKVTGFDVNPRAENLQYLGDGYYERAMRGKSVRWIRSRLGNKIVVMVEGDVVFPNFDRDVHVSKEKMEPAPGHPVTVGLDFGRRPAATFGQRLGRVRHVQFEAYMEGVGAKRFAPEVKRILAHNYPWALQQPGLLRIFGDPKGQDGTQTDETTAYDIFRNLGLTVQAAPVKQNNIRTRIEVLEVALDERRVLISPRCTRLIGALEGGYRFPRERPAPTEDRKPIKDKWSDIVDAEEYAELGDGGARELVGGTQARTVRATASTSPGHRRFAGARRPFR